MDKKYTDTEIIAAINAVHQILDAEDFALDVEEISDGDMTTALVFKLEDMQGGNLNNIEEEEFDTLASVIDRLDLYHDSTFAKPFDERIETKEEILGKDWDREVLMFFKSDYCTDILLDITAADYTDYVSTGFGKDVDRLNENKAKGINDLEYLLYKDIAQKILQTYSAHVMVEYEGKIYISDYAVYDNSNNKEQDFIADIKKYNQENQGYKNYREVVNSFFDGIEEDINGCGLLDRKGEWAFYLSRNELRFIGFDEDYLANIVREELDELPTYRQAEGLPKDWVWKMWTDGSGHLESPTGETYFDYDLQTSEYKIHPEDKGYESLLFEDFEHGGWSRGSFNDLETIAVKYIKETVLNNTKETEAPKEDDMTLEELQELLDDRDFDKV